MSRGKRNGLANNPRVSSGKLAGIGELSAVTIGGHLPSFYNRPEELVDFLLQQDWNEYWPGLNKALQVKSHWEQLEMADILIKAHYGHLVRHGRGGGWENLDNSPLPKTLENFWTYSPNGLWLTSQHFTLANLYPQIDAYLVAWKEQGMFVAPAFYPQSSINFVDSICNLTSDQHELNKQQDSMPNPLTRATSKIFPFWLEQDQQHCPQDLEYLIKSPYCLAKTVESGRFLSKEAPRVFLLADPSYQAIGDLAWSLIARLPKGDFITDLENHLPTGFSDPYNVGLEDDWRDSMTNKWNQSVKLFSKHFAWDLELGFKLQVIAKAQAITGRDDD